MELSDIVKRSAKLGSYMLVGIFAANQALTAFQSYKTLKSVINDNTRLHVPLDVLSQFNHLPQDLNVIDYLNLANSLVHNFGVGGGDCKDYTAATYQTYARLISLNNRTDLSNKTRLAIGWNTDIGHVYIEYKEDDLFKPYETMLPVPLVNPDKVKDYQRIKKWKDTPMRHIFMRSIPGTKILYQTFQAFTFPGGFVRVLVSTINTT